MLPNLSPGHTPKTTSQKLNRCPFVIHPLKIFKMTKVDDSKFKPMIPSSPTAVLARCQQIWTQLIWCNYKLPCFLTPKKKLKVPSHHIILAILQLCLKVGLFKVLEPNVLGGWVTKGWQDCWCFRNPKANHLGCIKSCKIMGINYQPQLVRRISAINSMSRVLSVHFFRSVFGSPFGWPVELRSSWPKLHENV